MSKPNRVSEASLARTIEDNYGLAIRTLSLLPLGADVDSVVFRLGAADGEDFLLKLRRLSGFQPASLLIPRYLDQQDLPHVLSPLTTQAGTAWVEHEGFALSLFPFVAGHRVAEAGMSSEHWNALGGMMRKVHTCRLPEELLQVLPRERFRPSRREIVPRLEAALTGPNQPDLLQRELAAFWSSHHTTIRRLITRADALGHQLGRTDPAMVLCHADLHTWNMLLDTQDRLWVLDWDEVTLAPKERDLMFVMVGIERNLIEPQQTASFLAGYGHVKIDPLALAYYRYAWAVQDLAAFGEQVCFLPGQDQDERRAALDYFIGLFVPGKIAEIAFASDGIAGE